MVRLKECFNQVCVWPNTEVDTDDESIKEFEIGFEKMIGCKVQFLERILTKPDTDDGGNIILHTGKRVDIFFAVHDDHVMRFATVRLHLGIRWIEDVLAKCNYHHHIYPNHVYNYVTWNEEEINFPEGVACAI